MTANVPVVRHHDAHVYAWRVPLAQVGHVPALHPDRHVGPASRSIEAYNAEIDKVLSELRQGLTYSVGRGTCVFSHQ